MWLIAYAQEISLYSRKYSGFVRNDEFYLGFLFSYFDNMFKGGYTYIVTNKHHTTLYIGVTSDIGGRTYDHKDHRYKWSFTDKYNAEYLVYYECFDSIEHAIAREKQLKKWSRKKKDALINTVNPEWRDLYDDVVNELM